MQETHQKAKDSKFIRKECGDEGAIWAVLFVLDAVVRSLSLSYIYIFTHFSFSRLFVSVPFLSSQLSVLK
jgi:hypothetical protein